MAMMSPTAIKAVLRQGPLFSDLPDSDLDLLSRFARPDWARAGTAIVKEGSDADGLIVLITGRAKVVISGLRGQDIILAIVEPPGVVGEIAVIDRSPRSATVITLQRTEYLQIPVAPFLALLGANVAFSQKLTRHLASTLRRSNEQLRAICTLPTDRRVAWCLLRIADQRGRRDEKGVIIRPRPMQQEIADMTACSRETVSRALRTLRRKNYVVPDGDGLRIHDSIARFLRDDRWVPGVTRTSQA